MVSSPAAGAIVRASFVTALAVSLLGLVGCAGAPTPSPAPSSTVSRTASPSPSAEPPASTPTAPEHTPPAPADALARAVWVHLFDSSLTTRAGIRSLVADLVAARATAVIAEVVRRQDAYYDSDVLPRTTDPNLEPGLDVLAALLEDAHAAGLEVHAWVPVTPTWHALYDGLPAPAGWVSTEHGPDGPEADRWVTRAVDGGWEPYLDPALPEVRAHVAAVVGEIAARYDVDGVHLDYLRYHSDQHGYHPRALERYQAETGAVGVPEPGDPAWSDWRREQVDGLLVAARDAVRATGSRAVLSAAVIAWGDGPGGSTAADFTGTRAYREVFQDWAGWAEAGLVDALLPMDYVREADPQQAGWLRTWLDFQAALAGRTGVRVVPGVAGYLNAPDDAMTQVTAAAGALGAVAIFSYQGSTDDVAHPLWADLAGSDWGGVPAPG